MRLFEGINITQDLVKSALADPDFLLGFESEFFVETEAESGEEEHQVRWLIYKMVADRIGTALNEPAISAYDAETAVTASEGYTKWVVTRDADLYDGEFWGREYGDGFSEWRMGVEVISPAKQLADGISSMEKFLYFLNEGGLPNVETNENTGFHINLGIKNIEENLDIVKLLFLLDDDYVLKKFGRLHSDAAASMYQALNYSVQSGGAKPVITKLENLLKADQQDINQVRNILKDHLVNDKRMSMNLGKMDKGYIEFRHAGGNYLEQIHDIIDTVIQFAVVMHVARTPNLMRKEYLSALYKFVIKVGREFDGIYDSVGMIGHGFRGGYGKNTDGNSDGEADGPYDGENYISKYGIDFGNNTS